MRSLLLVGHFAGAETRGTKDTAFSGDLAIGQQIVSLHQEWLELLHLKLQT